MKLSVLIPTINQVNENWRKYIDIVKEQLFDLAPIYDELFEDTEILTIENELVNPAWNKLVKQAKGDIVLIINDDIEIWAWVFETLAKLKKWQVYCPYFTRADDRQTIHKHNGINIVWFCFWMFKEDWQDIPSELRLYYWDNFIFNYINKDKYNVLWGWLIHHHESKSINSPENRTNIREIIRQDKINWKLLFNK